MVKSFVFVAGLVALAGQNVYGQDIPTAALGALDTASLSSILAEAQSSLAALQTDPVYSSMMKDPTFSSAMAQASSFMANPSAAAASAARSSGSSVQPIGVAALVVSAAVAVGML